MNETQLMFADFRRRVAELKASRTREPRKNLTLDQMLATWETK